MTLDQAIKHLNEVLSKNKFNCEECKKEHIQLRKWLIELKDLRTKYAEMRSEI